MASDDVEYLDEENGMTHECGVFGCVATGDWPTDFDVANVISLALVGLQHRGQECAGIATATGNDSDTFSVHRGMGLVSHIYNPHILSGLEGNLGIGHTRYSTHGKSVLGNCQPFVVDTMHGQIAVAHNGELVNKKSLREEVLKRGVGLSSSSDSEVITQMLCFPPLKEESNGPNWVERIKYLMQRAPLAYSLLIMHGPEIFAVRDPFGNRPLCIGKLHAPGKDSDVEGWVVSSESCVFQSIGAVMHREVEPGEIVSIGRNGVTSHDIVPRPRKSPPALCIFEYVYFARPDSIIDGQMVYGARYRCGEQLALESPIAADVIGAVPESATAAGHGYASQSGLPFMDVLAKNRYIGRTFIQPTRRLRQLAVAKKFGPLEENINGKRVVLVDDSIVRGNTMGPIVEMLRKGGAKEVHIRIASPPLKNACYMGINIPNPKELVANKMSVKEIADMIGADSLAYLSLDGLVSSVKKGAWRPSFSKHEYGTDNDDKVQPKDVGYCIACLDGNYPVDLEW